MWLLVLIAVCARVRGVSFHLMVSNLINLATLVLPVVITCRCIWPSSPARVEMAIHTLPVGRWVLIFAQSFFLLLAVVLPWVVLDICAVLGFGFDAVHWSRLVLGSLLTVLVPIGLSCAWMSVARTPGHQGVIFLVAVITWWVLVFLVQMLEYTRIFTRLEPTVTETVLWSSSVIRYQVHLFGLGFLGLALWLLQAVTRRRTLVFSCAVAGLTGLLIVEACWPWDWLSQGEPAYTGGPLRAVVGDPMAAPQGDATRLWPGLEIAGLRRGEVPLVADFRPWNLRLSSGYTDAEPRDSREFSHGRDRIGVHADVLRTIASSLPEAWLCTDNGDLPVRLPLRTVWEIIGKKPPEDWQGRRLDPTAMPWRLRLAVIEPILVGEFALADLKQGREALLRPGVWMSLREKSPTRGFMELQFDVVSRRSVLSPAYPRFTHGAPWDNDSPQKMYLVLLNDAQRLAHIELSRSVTDDFVGTRGLSINTGYYQTPINIEAPTNRMKLTGLTREEWISQTRVQLWWPRLKGFTELEIPAADVKRLAGK
jgi:hypothetical protein